MSGGVGTCQILWERVRLQAGKVCPFGVPLELAGNGQAGVIVTLILFYVQRQE